MPCTRLDTQFHHQDEMVAHGLGIEGRERAGRFSRGQWDEVIRLSEKHLTTSAV